MARYRYDKELQRVVGVPAREVKNASELVRELDDIDKNEPHTDDSLHWLDDFAREFWEAAYRKYGATNKYGVLQ